MFNLLKLYLSTLVRPVTVYWSRSRQARTASQLPSATIAAVVILPAQPPQLSQLVPASYIVVCYQVLS